MSNIIQNWVFDEERALYHLCDATVEDCTFAGPADGESALKESRHILVRRCDFSLRYPLWHCCGFRMENCTMDGTARAALWYAENGRITDCRLEGIKCLRECEDIVLKNTVIRSPECGWRCRRIDFEDCDIESEYFLFETAAGTLRRIKMRGKYSFQYAANLILEDAELNTKDAFWHSRNVTVRHSVLRGEYLGWYSEGLTLIDCHIQGTQPLCYCKGLTLINCTMEDTDLSFECSDVQAQIKGDILSVKNPHTGSVTAEHIGAVILEDAVMTTDCVIRQTAEK